MEANKRNLVSVFGQPIQLMVPLFQRPYVWDEEKQWLPLWENIQALADRQLAGPDVRPHFLGAVVLDQLKMPTGTVETRQVIDGQQRLTTLQLFLAAARDAAQALGAIQHSRAFGTLTRNDLPLSQNPDEEFKVWPTNVDRVHFRRTLRAGSPESLRREYLKKDKGKIGHRIPDAYLYFYEEIARWASEDGEEYRLARLDSLHKTVQSHLLFVVIDLDERDDAQIIFETLNALGTPLLPADLVKNYLFHAAQGEGWPIEELYAEYWKPFDRDEEFWRAEVTQGRLKRPNIDLFLQYYLTLATNDEVIATHLFTTFRDYVRKTPALTAGDHLSGLAAYADVYRRLTSFERETREGVFFYRLALMETTTVIPFLLELFKQQGGGQGDSDITDILNALESFLVRRLVCRLTTKNYNRLFLDLVQRLRQEGGFTAAGVQRFLLEQKGDSGRWPNDAEFQASWVDQPLYRLLVRKRLRMILEAVDAGLHGKFTERLHISGKLQVEHLIPQSWKEHWPLTDPNIPPQRRDDLVQTIGNLTLVTENLNPSLSNGPWAMKRDKILDHSALNLNRPLRVHQTWTEADITARSHRLFETARQIWPYPAAE
ncbi:MAG TPA: DUF262 domain-containing protein [Longimicrobium sp.]|nr:DUF262 domain-containing protein [Longimicrobium sp.]